MGRTRSNLNQNLQMIGRNHTREQGLQVCRRKFLKKTFGNTSKIGLKLGDQNGRTGGTATFEDEELSQNVTKSSK